MLTLTLAPTLALTLTLTLTRSEASGWSRSEAGAKLTRHRNLAPTPYGGEAHGSGRGSRARSPVITRMNAANPGAWAWLRGRANGASRAGPRVRVLPDSALRFKFRVLSIFFYGVSFCTCRSFFLYFLDTL